MLSSLLVIVARTEGALRIGESNRGGADAAIDHNNTQKCRYWYAGFLHGFVNPRMAAEFQHEVRQPRRTPAQLIVMRKIKKQAEHL